MAWNIFMHVLIGLMGADFFTFTAKGILFAVLIVTVTQASDLFRVYKDKKKKIEEGPEKEQSAKLQELKDSLPTFLGMTFVKGLFYYTLLVMVSSEVARSGGVGF
ncbi:MAG: hypothetical protein IME96_10250 [Proteobacteria bacterium]|nr:hypothetical protein [Pseudomonadota bacterium]